MLVSSAAGSGASRGIVPIDDQHVIPPSRGTVNIPRVEPRSTRALIPQHGRAAAPLPWGTSLSIASRAFLRCTA